MFMDLNLKIKDIGFADVLKFKIKCHSCDYWFKCNKRSLVKEFNKSFKLLDFFRSKLFELKSKNNYDNLLGSFIKNGGKIKIAYLNKSEIKAIMIYGSPYLFPKLKEFKVYPPDSSSIFLACMFVEPEYQDFGVGERLLLSVEKDMLKQGKKSLETVAKRQNDDISDNEYEDLHLIPFKFLIKNGFFIKKNDEYFPLLKLDLSIIETMLTEEESLFARLFKKKELSRSTFVNTKNSKTDLNSR
jgi:GNAT superfamily N-acetyltransferase